MLSLLRHDGLTLVSEDFLPLHIVEEFVFLSLILFHFDRVFYSLNLELQLLFICISSQKSSVISRFQSISEHRY